MKQLENRIITSDSSNLNHSFQTSIGILGDKVGSGKSLAMLVSLSR